MNEFAPNEKILQLEQRHVQLIDELDALDCRLEQTLTSFFAENNSDAIADDAC